MFSQKKEYLQLFRKNEKLKTAGLCKLIIWDQKIKIDYYMDHLPIGDNTAGICHLIYLVRKEGEQNLLQREATFPFLFLKSQFHYAFQTRETADHKIVKIENCYIELAEQYRIFMHGYHLKVQAGQQDLQQVQREKQAGRQMQAEQHMQVTGKQQDAKQHMPVAENQQDTDRKLLEQDIEPDLAAQETSALVENQTAEEPADTSGEEIHASEKTAVCNQPDQMDYPVRRIDNLKELLSMGEDFVELYYNSFLLHSFYQYRHLLLGKDFLAVPGYFYEREAIAAKMMGFPYFIEAQHVDHCSMGEGKRMEKPVDGTYGYFIRATAS